MENERKKLLKRIDELITKRKSEMLKELPSIHEIDDGIIIRFFTDWDNCEDDNDIKFKKIVNCGNPNDSTIFFFIPKGSFFDLKQRFYIGSLTCLNGIIDITVDNNTKQITGYSKISVNSDEVTGLALENTYLITSSDKSKWKKSTHDHVKEVHGY
jgi:hypothetical protein